MILVDSSVWIDYFNGSAGAETDLLDRLMDSGRLLVGDLILAEVLQGFRSEHDAARALARFRAFQCASMVKLRSARRGITGSCDEEASLSARPSIR